MCSDIAISVEKLGKCFQIYDQPRDRLKQFVLPKLQSVFGLLSKQYYHEFWALNNVSFEVKKGETVGIIGCNGSGKSTLLQMICGTLNPTIGKIQTNGRIAALLELGSGFNPEFTGRENVYLNAAVHGLRKDETDARFDDIVSFSEIGDFLNQPIKTYSSGMLVRLAFAVAINVDPEILVVDEALSVGDERFQRKCFSKIESIRDNGATILFVSHSAVQVVELCNRAILLDAGEKLAYGNPKMVVGSYQKLLYAPDEKKEIIRKQILNKYTTSFKNHELLDKKQPISENFNEKNEVLKETFDPNFNSTSIIEYESYGPIIDKTELLTLTGEQVNGIIRGREYQFHFIVEFNKSASNVRFGMLIKTKSGLPIGGALTAPFLNKTIPFIPAGKKVDVKFKFKCFLNPEVYFFNAGVFGFRDEEEVVLHRIADALSFRVLPVTNNISTEIIDFDFDSEVKIDGENIQ